MPVRILVADFSIWTMDNKLGFLIAGNAPCNFDCFCLCLGSRCSAGVPFAFYLPPAIGVRSYVLIFSFHTIILSKNEKDETANILFVVVIFEFLRECKMLSSHTEWRKCACHS